MIPKSNKFPTRVQFLNFRSRANQVVTPHLRLMTEERPFGGQADLKGPRLSVIVPVKVSKRAVVRNNFKRLIYDAAWKAFSNKNIDCIIIFKPIGLLKGPTAEAQILAELNSVIHDL